MSLTQLKLWYHMCAGLPLTCIHGWPPHPALALIPCVIALLASTPASNLYWKLGWATNPSLPLVNALLTTLALQQTILDCCHLFFPLRKGCFSHHGKAPKTHSGPLQSPPLSRTFGLNGSERNGEGKKRKRRIYRSFNVLSESTNLPTIQVDLLFAFL